MDEDGDDELLALLDDEYARAILVAASLEPLSASELADRCDASRTTVYRQLERLEAAGLVSREDDVISASLDGHEAVRHLPRLQPVVAENDQLRLPSRVESA